MSQLPPHLIVDGYNILHAEASWKQRMSIDFDGSRAAFIDQARIVYDAEPIRMTVVFDGRGSRTEIEKPGGQGEFSVVYAAADLTADGVIEQLVRVSKEPSRCIVASEDNFIRESVRASGGLVIGADELFSWIERARRRMAEILQRQSSARKKAPAEDNPWTKLDHL